MFPLSRPARQGLATAALAILTILPTVFTAQYAWKVNRPGHVRDVEITLGRRLGLQVTLDSVVYPRPGEILYKGIVLRQEEPRGQGFAELLRADSLRLVQAGRELTVHADALALRGESPALAMDGLGGFLQRSGEVPFDRVELTAPGCKLDLGGGLVFDAHDLAATLATEASGPTLRAAYRLGGSGAKTRCELTLLRDRRVDPVETTLALKTLEGPPLSASVLGVFFDAADWMGDDARVDGRLTLKRRDGHGWEGEFTGDLHGVDLASLVTRRFPAHRLSGTARVSIDQARWGDRPGQGPGWLEADGRLVAGPGEAGVELISALAREMKFRPSTRHGRLDPRKTEIEFSSLGLAFAMRPDGEIQINGALSNEHAPDAVLAAGAFSLIHAPEGAASVHSLIKTLVPADGKPGTLVPLNTESRVLLCLPVASDSRRPSRAMGAN